MAKKNFSAALNAGVARDQKLRDASVASRFDRVESALAGRSTLLDASSDERSEASVATAYVETLEKEGKVKSTYAAWPIDKIDDNPLNSRTVYHEEKISAR